MVFPSSFEVLIFAKSSKRFAYPAFISIGLISSEEIKSPYAAKIFSSYFYWFNNCFHYSALPKALILEIPPSGKILIFI